MTIHPETIDPGTIGPGQLTPETIDPDTNSPRDNWPRRQLTPKTIGPETIDPGTIGPHSKFAPVQIDPQIKKFSSFHFFLNFLWGWWQAFFGGNSWEIQMYLHVIGQPMKLLLMIFIWATCISFRILVRNLRKFVIKNEKNDMVGFIGWPIKYIVLL